MQKKTKDSEDEDKSEDDKAEKPNKKIVGKAKRKWNIIMNLNYRWITPLRQLVVDMQIISIQEKAKFIPQQIGVFEPNTEPLFKPLAE